MGVAIFFGNFLDRNAGASASECRKYKEEGASDSFLKIYRLFYSVSCVQLLYKSPKSKSKIIRIIWPH